MKKEIILNEDLYYLENVLFTLTFFNFDNEISNLLNKLKLLVNKRLWDNLEDEDITDFELVFRYDIEKN